MKKSDNRHIAIGYLCVFVLALIFYSFSCAPGALWQDSGMYHYRIWHNDIEGNLGLALAHPLYHVIGIIVKAIPLGEFGFRINFLSAIFGALTVANVFLLLRLWLGELLPAVIGAIMLAVSWTFWQHCSIAEVYTLYTAIFTAELIFLFQYFKTEGKGWLYLVFLFNGLSIANHMWGVIPLACYVVLCVFLLCRKKIKISDAGFIILVWVVAAGLYEYLIIKAIVRTGDVTGVLRSALFGLNWKSKVLNVGISPKITFQNFIFIGYNFLTLNFLLLFVGLYTLNKNCPKPGFGHILAAMFLLFFVFAFRYKVPDRYAFFIPFYCLVVILIGLGAKVLCQRYRWKGLEVILILFTVLPVIAYQYVPTILDRLGIGLPTKRQIPYRGDSTYFLQPWKGGDQSCQLFATEALETVKEQAVIIADGTTVYPLWYYQQIKGLRPDVKIVSWHQGYTNPIEFPTVDTIEKIMENTDVYVVSPVGGYCPQFLLDNYDFVPRGSIYEVVRSD
jgi:hypothetical protein